MTGPPSAPDNAPQAGSRDRRPLAPGRPAAGLWWLRSRRLLPRRVPAALLLAAVILLIIVLGSWGFDSLGVKPSLGIPTAIYRASKLFALDMGMASGGGPRPNWQL